MEFRVGAEGGQGPPIGMVLVVPIIPNETVIGRAMKTVAMTLLHDFAEVVAVLHIAMHLSNFCAPEAEAYGR